MSQVSYLHLRHTDAAAWLFLHTSCQVVFILTNKVRIAFACWTFVACKFSIPRLTVGYISSLKHESYEFAVSLALLVSSMTCLVPWTSSRERTPCHVHFTRLYSNVCCSQHLQLALECFMSSQWRNNEQTVQILVWHHAGHHPQASTDHLFLGYAIGSHGTVPAKPAAAMLRDTDIVPEPATFVYIQQCVQSVSCYVLLCCPLKMLHCNADPHTPMSFIFNIERLLKVHEHLFGEWHWSGPSSTE